MTGVNKSLSIPVIKLPLILIGVSLVLVVLYLLTKNYSWLCEIELCDDLETFFDLDGEANLPSWFAALCWFIAGLAAIPHALRPSGSGSVWHWRGIVAVCIFLSMDEAAVFHETFGSALGETVSAEDVFFFDWLLYGIAMVVIVALLYLPFLRALPRGTAVRIVLAAVVFVSGAIGIEMLGAAQKAGVIDFIQGRGWLIEVAMEEFCEMAGVALFIHALLYHLAFEKVTVEVSAG